MKLKNLHENDTRLQQLIRLIKQEPDNIEVWERAFHETARADKHLIFIAPRYGGEYAVTGVMQRPRLRPPLRNLPGDSTGVIQGRLIGIQGENQAFNVGYEIGGEFSSASALASTLSLSHDQIPNPVPPKDSSDCTLDNRGISHGSRCGCKSSPGDPYGEAWLRKHRENPASS